MECLQKCQDKRWEATQRNSWGDWKCDQERKRRESGAVGSTCEEKVASSDPVVHEKPNKNLFISCFILFILSFIFPVSDRALPKRFSAWFLSLTGATHETFTVPWLRSRLLMSFTAIMGIISMWLWQCPGGVGGVGPVQTWWRGWDQEPRSPQGELSPWCLHQGYLEALPARLWITACLWH